MPRAIRLDVSDISVQREKKKSNFSRQKNG